MTLWEDQLRSWNHVMRDDFFDRQQLTGQSFSARCILYLTNTATLVKHLTRRTRRLMTLIVRLSL